MEIMWILFLVTHSVRQCLVLVLPEKFEFQQVAENQAYPGNDEDHNEHLQHWA